MLTIYHCCEQLCF